MWCRTLRRFVTTAVVLLLCTSSKVEATYRPQKTSSSSSKLMASRLPQARSRVHPNNKRIYHDESLQPQQTSSQLTTSRGGESLRAASTPERLWDIFRAFWYLALFAFGGPPAHLSLLREIATEQQQWLTEAEFLELMSVAASLPGPFTTQMIVATAISHAGVLGGLLAFCLWNLPGFVALAIAGKSSYDLDEPPVWLRGIPPAGLALALKSGMRFWQQLDSLQKTVAIGVSMVAILINADLYIPKTSSNFIFPALLVLGGLTTLISSRVEQSSSTPSASALKRGQKAKVARVQTGNLAIFGDLPIWSGFLAFSVWLTCYVSAPLVWDRGPLWDLWATSFRVGSSVFSGGPAIVPMLSGSLVPGLVKESEFFQGVGLAQSLPGSFFNLAAYLGGAHKGWLGAIVAHTGLFSPGLLLLFAILPFWSHLRQYEAFRHLMRGVSASAVGLMGSACVSVYSGSIKNGSNAMVLVFTSGLLAKGYPRTLVLALGASMGALLSILGLGQKLYGSERWSEMASQEVLESNM